MAANWRNEAILQSIIDGTEYTDDPQSRIEELLIQLKQLIETSGGVSDYEQLTNKPKINGVELVGDQSSDELGMESLTPEQKAALLSLL